MTSSGYTVMQQPHTIRAHACFRLDVKTPISNYDQLLDGSDDLFELWHSLSYRIMRKPDDLLAHTRRIRLCQEPALQDRLAGAHRDLAHVLGDHGSSLQSRLQNESLIALEKQLLREDAFPASAIRKASADLLSATATQASNKGRVLPTVTQLLQAVATDDNSGTS